MMGEICRVINLVDIVEHVRPHLTLNRPLSKRAVAASVAATSPALEMVSCGEDDISVGIVITVFLAAARMRLLEECQNFALHRHGIFPLVPKPRHGLKTRPAQARRLETICGQSA